MRERYTASTSVEIFKQPKLLTLKFTKEYLLFGVFSNINFKIDKIDICSLNVPIHTMIEMYYLSNVTHNHSILITNHPIPKKNMLHVFPSHRSFTVE